MAASAPASGRWLFGPGPDLLLGCGGLYCLLLLVFVFTGSELRAHQPSYLAPLLILLLSEPHYAGTLLRVYERREDRRRYAIFALWVTLVVAVAFVVGLYSMLVGSLLATIFLTWSPWHYTGQNYGLAVMFLRRRGVALEPPTKRLLHASFILSYVLTALVMHGADGSAADNLLSYTGGAGPGRVRFLPLGIPETISSWLVPGVAFAYLAALAASVVSLRRGASSWRDLAPAGVLALTQASWFSLPFALRHLGTSPGVEALDWDFRVHYFLWIMLGHAVQYLWVTTYYARAGEQWRGTLHYLGKTLLAGPALWIYPLILFAPWSLGDLSYDAGLFLVAASAINIHHFILDGAIWKLRDSRIAGVLLRSEDASQRDPVGESKASWLRRSVWSLTAAGALLALYFYVENLRYNAALAGGRYAEATVLLDRLSWFGSDGAQLRLGLGQRLEKQGRVRDALREYEQSATLEPNPAAYARIGTLKQRSGDWQGAIDAYEAALSLEPERAGLLHRVGVAWMELGRPERAVEPLERALALRPDAKPIERSLDKALRAREDRAEGQ